jgi:protein gp37
VSANSKIEWCDSTWNVVTGCTSVSEGCKHCYAKRDWARLSANPKTVYFGREFSNVKCHPEFLSIPLLWKKPARIFVNSMSDLFHPDVPFLFVNKVFDTIDRCPHHTFMILTKRPRRMLEYISEYRDIERSNLWLGVTAENQATADERIPLLLQTPAAKRFISIEPMLGAVLLNRPTPIPTRYDDHGNGIEWIEEVTWLWKLDWVIVGGESGPKARPIHSDWVRSIRDQCKTAGVPFMFKQWGEWLPWIQFNESIVDDDPEQTRHKTSEYQNRKWVDVGYPAWFDDVDDLQCVARVGKKRAGRVLDGVIHDEYPGLRNAA